jgi:hypothetical protein
MMPPIHQRSPRRSGHDNGAVLKAWMVPSSLPM